MTSSTGKRVKRPKPDDWSFEITITFEQVPDEKKEAYWAALKYFASVLMQDLTAPEAEEAVSG